MAESGIKSLSAFFIEKTDIACEKEFGHLLEPDSAVRYGDAYAKYVDNALVRLEGMAAYAECLLEGHAASMTVAGILSKWRNRLQVVRECKENMRVFARSEKEIVTLFRKFCRGCLDMAAGQPDANPDTGRLLKDFARQRKEAVLTFLGELFPMPELYEVSDRYPIPHGENGAGQNIGAITKKQEKKVKITIELTEREARAYETMMTAEKKIRAALAEAAEAEADNGPA
jgi:hypothetical protein